MVVCGLTAWTELFSKRVQFVNLKLEQLTNGLNQIIFKARAVCYFKIEILDKRFKLNYFWQSAVWRFKLNYFQSACGLRFEPAAAVWNAPLALWIFISVISIIIIATALDKIIEAISEHDDMGSVELKVTCQKLQHWNNN